MHATNTETTHFYLIWTRQLDLRDFAGSGLDGPEGRGRERLAKKNSVSFLNGEIIHNLTGSAEASRPPPVEEKLVLPLLRRWYGVVAYWEDADLRYASLECTVLSPHCDNSDTSILPWVHLGDTCQGPLQWWDVFAHQNHHRADSYVVLLLGPFGPIVEIGEVLSCPRLPQGLHIVLNCLPR